MWAPTVYSDELYHHGIKGQKWGVRHYQNPDGSYTAAGLARYGKGIKAAGKKLITTPDKNYTSTTTTSLKKKYGSKDSRTKKSAELDKKIQSIYADDNVHLGTKWFKETFMGNQQRLTYNMSLAAGESRGKAFVRSVFDVNVASLTAEGARYKVRNEINKSMIRGGEETFDGRMLGYLGGKATQAIVEGSFVNSGTELSLQQRQIRKKYMDGTINKKKKR